MRFWTYSGALKAQSWGCPKAMHSLEGSEWEHYGLCLAASVFTGTFVTETGSVVRLSPVVSPVEIFTTPGSIQHWKSFGWRYKKKTDYRNGSPEKAR